MFGWTQVGPKNQNWQCVDDQHNKKSHPSDVVYWYGSPYASEEDERLYVNIDLKSYAKETISPGKVADALRNLAKSVECAQKSPDWQKLFVNTDFNSAVFGLLFIFNHDGEYDLDLAKSCAALPIESIELTLGVRIALFSPTLISYLSTVANDISRKFGEDRKPGADTYQFYYPNLIRTKAQSQFWPVGTIELLTGPWQIVRWVESTTSTPRQYFRLYYSGAGEVGDEFKYMLDYLFRYQLVDKNNQIGIRLPFASPNSAALFETAKDQYFQYYFRSFHTNEVVQELKKTIVFEPVTRISNRFHSIEIGMQDR